MNAPTNMMNKTLENMQQLSKEWGAYSRRMSRDALRAMSGQLETAARYLGDLSERLDERLAEHLDEHMTNHAKPNENGHAQSVNGHEHEAAAGEPPRDSVN